MKPTLVEVVSPWHVFDKLWTLASGYPAQNFHLTPEGKFMTTFGETTTATILYYMTIFLGHEYMHNRQAFQLNDLFQLHNLVLVISSAALLSLFLEQLLPTIWIHGLYYSICGPGGWTDQLVILYYLNYLLKYVELLDTIFILLKKKRLTFLHCYHHGATAILCYTQLKGQTSVSWVPITLNLMVHVVMYWYYFKTSRGSHIWWKEWITRLQILQFIIDIGFIYFASYNVFASKHYPTLPLVGQCAGTEFSALAGCTILSSYLLLFIWFYLATYGKSSQKSSAVMEAKEAKGRSL